MESQFKVADRLIETNASAIHVNGDERRIDRMAMKVLVYLAQRPGRDVSRNELLGEVWEGRAVTDDVLTGAISRLRKALGDSASAPSFLRTLPGYGYRLVADVGPADGTSTGGSRVHVLRQWHAGPPLHFATGALFGVGCYLLLVCVILA